MTHPPTNQLGPLSRASGIAAGLPSSVSETTSRHVCRLIRDTVNEQMAKAAKGFVSVDRVPKAACVMLFDALDGEVRGLAYAYL